MKESVKKFILQVCEEFGADGPPSWDLDTLPDKQFEEMLGRIEDECCVRVVRVRRAKWREAEAEA